MDKEVELHMHRCGVRYLLRMRKEHGKEWLRKFLMDSKWDNERLSRVMDDITLQWKLGNRGDVGIWFE